MKNASLAVRASLLIFSLFFLVGCKSVSPDDPVAPADGVSVPTDGTGATGGEDGDDASGNSGNATDSVPSIWGDPAGSAVVGAMYMFRPEASDGDGDVLEFSIANKPDWAGFDRQTGTLSGIPAADDVGKATTIVISVTDQTSIASLPSFNIAVDQVVLPADDNDDQDAKSPPTLAGMPHTSAIVGKPYSFQPVASDADGDELSFSIVNKPSWAEFDTTTGRLQGTPTDADVGSTDPIELSVTDDTAIAALAPFRIDVEQAGSRSFTLQWTAPTENEDGSPLTDLAGYRIYYGTVPGEYTEEIVLDSPGLSSYVIEDLAPGRYYLVMTSFNSRDMESKHTAEYVADTADSRSNGP